DRPADQPLPAQHPARQRRKDPRRLDDELQRRSEARIRSRARVVERGLGGKLVIEPARAGAFMTVYRLDGATAIASDLSSGPWGRMQHGSAPAALIAHVAEAMPSALPMRVARLTIDLMRPVPIAPLTIKTEVLRDGRKIRLLRIDLLAEGTL